MLIKLEQELTLKQILESNPKKYYVYILPQLGWTL